MAAIKLYIMPILLFLSFLIEYSLASYILHVQYFRQPSEYAIFQVRDEFDKQQWTTYVHMDKSRSWKEEEVMDAIKPIFDGPPQKLSYQANWITRHIGVQFKYVLTKFDFDHMIFENLCSQMKPKFGGLLANSTQRPSKLEFVVEHPSSMFTLPEGFRLKGMGRDQIKLRIGGRAILDGENLDFDSIINTKSLIVEHGDEFPSLLDSNKIMSLKCETLLLQGKNKIEKEHVQRFVTEWVNGEREVQKWEIYIDQENGDDLDQKGTARYHWEKKNEKNSTLEVRVTTNGRLTIEAFASI